MKRFAALSIGIFLIFLILFVLNLNKNRSVNQTQTFNMDKVQKENIDNEFSITPISHATLTIDLNGKTIYVDPVGGQDAFSGQKPADIILITDIHGDHFDPKTLTDVSTENTIVVMPQAAKDQLTQDVKGNMHIMANGQTKEFDGIKIETVPMYNVPESDNAYHTKGRGNGYIVEGNGKRIYIAGDTGNTPEMRNLKNIDIAFVPMNLPYTMTVEEAAEAVLAFKPKVVHPYHYRGQDGFSDVERFKKLVEEEDKNIKVELLNFYP